VSSAASFLPYTRLPRVTKPPLAAVYCAQGVNWWGSEGVGNLMEGLLENPISFYFKFLREHRQVSPINLAPGVY